MKTVKAKNKAAIIEWKKNNPFGSQEECAVFCEISVSTVSRLTQEIKKGI